MGILQKLKKSLILPWVIVGLLVISMSVEACAYNKTGGLNPLKIFSKKDNIQKIVKPSPAPAASTTSVPVAKTAAAPKRIVDAGVNWIAPEKLANQEFFKTTAQEDFLVNESVYYKIASLTAGGEIILATLPVNGPTPPLTLRFLKDSAGKT